MKANKNSMIFALVSIGATGLFILFLFALHLLKPELDPAWHFISEYAIGNWGWLMQLAFLSLAISNVALYLSIHRILRGWFGWAAKILYLVGAFGAVLGGIFVTDPLNTRPEMATTSGILHNLGGTLNIFGFLGTLMISWKLFRNDAWAFARKTTVLATGIVIAGFLISFVSIATLTIQHGGAFGPDVPVGLPNRIGVLAGCAWLLLIALQAIKMQRREPREL